MYDGEENEKSSSLSSSSSSSSSEWKTSPVIVGRAECFKSNSFHHIEDRNPHTVANELSAFAWRKNKVNLKITINDIIVPMNSDNNIREDILSTIENEKHFFKKGDFDIC